MAEENGQSLKEKLEGVERLLSDYEDKFYLNTIILREVNLDVTRDTLFKMDYRDIYGLSWDYAQYSLALSREYNKQQSRFSWADSNLQRVLEFEANEQPGYGWSEKKALVLNSNVYAQKLYHLKQQSKLVVDRLYGLSQKVEFLAKLAKDIAYINKQQLREESYSHGE